MINLPIIQNITGLQREWRFDNGTITTIWNQLYKNCFFYLNNDIVFEKRWFNQIGSDLALYCYEAEITRCKYQNPV